MSPAYAGMIPTMAMRTTMMQREPRMRGDDPKIRHYVTKFRTDIAILNMLSPDLQKAADMSKEDADNVFSDEPYNAMMEMLVIAFGEKYTADEIAEFVDVSMIPDIFKIFFAASGYKDEAKKKTQKKK